MLLSPVHSEIFQISEQGLAKHFHYNIFCLSDSYANLRTIRDYARENIPFINLRSFFVKWLFNGSDLSYYLYICALMV